MNNKEVYINDILLDLDEDNNPIRLIYAINDLAELKDRQAYSTNTFKIPNTQKNKIACGIPDNAQLIQTQPYRKNTAKIVQNGIEILTNGTAIITSSGEDIQVQVLSGLIGFFDIIADKKISDLDLSEYDHTWNLTNVAASQSNTDGYVYPVIDYGSLSNDSRRADVRQLRPATFRKTIIEKIVSEAGYTISGNPLSYDKYVRSLIPFSNDKFSHSKAYAELISGLKVSARKTINQQIDSGTLEQLIILQDDATTDPGNAWDGYVYTSPNNFKATVTFKYSIDQRWTVPVGGSTPETYMFIDYNSGSGFNNIAQNVTTCSQRLVLESFNDQVITVEINFKSGDQIRIRDLQQPATNRMQSVVKAGAELTITPISEDVIYGSSVQLSATLPDITQKNFFKDFLQNFGLIVIPNNYTKELLLINMEDVYGNKPIALDITEKIIDSPDDISYSFDGYGINNYGKYKDDDAVPDGTGDGVIVLDNLTLNDNVTLFTSIFAASVSNIKMGGVRVCEIKKISDPDKSLDFSIKTQPRILLNNYLSGQFILTDGANSNTVNLVSVPLFDGLSYADLFNENYPEIKRMLYRPFLVNKKILLKEIDIANIDWRIPVYDAKSASYYYKNQISYIQGNVSEISLIRMP